MEYLVTNPMITATTALSGGKRSGDDAGDSASKRPRTQTQGQPNWVCNSAYAPEQPNVLSVFLYFFGSTQTQPGTQPTSLSQLDNAAVRSKSFMAVYEQMCTVRSAIEKESDATIRAILNSKLTELQEALKEHAPSSSASDASK